MTVYWLSPATPKREKYAKNILHFLKGTKPKLNIRKLFIRPCTSTNLVVGGVFRNLSNIYDGAFLRKLLMAFKLFVETQYILHRRKRLT